MARKRPPEEHENHERWLVSYADFITLLFAFFVVMYAISSVNEGKFRVMSESLLSAFRDPSHELVPIRIGQPASGGSGVLDFSSIPMPVPRRPNQPAQSPSTPGEDQLGMRRLAEAIKAKLSPLARQGVLDVRDTSYWVEVEIRASLLFESAEVEMAPQGEAVLKTIAGVVEETPYRLQVEGYTDDLPILTHRFPSNWELSAHRAAAVVREFERSGINGARMSIVGYGAERPKVPNSSEEARAINRRVVLVISADESIQRQLELERAKSVGELIDGGHAEIDAALGRERAPLQTQPSAPPQSPSHSTVENSAPVPDSRESGGRGYRETLPAVGLPPLPQSPQGRVE
jgi:chemotaxis protein MotB